MTVLAIAEQRVSLRPGSNFVAEVPAIISTVVGTSAAVCLWSPAAAGMSHFVLPRGGGDRSARYGNHALPMLLETILAHGATRSSLVASLFGGSGGALGRQNLAEAKGFLARHAIPVVREDAGRNRARKLTFRSVDGSSVVRDI